MKRDIQGKFALKNDDYRLVRSLRLTDETWKALGIASECFGLTRADYLSAIVRDGTLPRITPEEELIHPSNTWEESEAQPRIIREIENLGQPELNTTLSITTALPEMTNLKTLRDRVLLSLKLGKQAPGYRAALKALNHFITELTNLE